MKFLGAVLACLVLGQFAQADSTAETPTPDQVRDAVRRSLPFLEKAGLTWMRDRACISCHQVPSMVWTFNESARHDLNVDTAKGAGWNEWSLGNVQKKLVFYRLTEPMIPTLKKEGISDADLAKLQLLKNKNYVFATDFQEALAKRLPSEVLAKHGETFAKVAGRSGQGGAGGGENSQYTALLLAGAPAASANPDAMTDALVAGIAKLQNKDGSWPVASQFTLQQRTTAEAAEVVTLWTAFALADAPRLSDDGAKALAKAREWLKTSRPSVSTETQMLRMLLAKKAGADDVCREQLASLLNRQHSDGGWSWLADGSKSDPYTTGQVLYALSYLGRDGSDPAVQNAWKYLLARRNDQGIWSLPMKAISATKKEQTPDGDAVYTYWATGWAVIGLLRTLPN